MRIGRVNNVTRNTEVNLIDAYPNILTAFLQEQCTEIRAIMYRTGDYCAYISRGGINVVYMNDENGRETLQTVSDYDLSRMLGTNEEHVNW